jgi:hypothetical protein
MNTLDFLTTILPDRGVHYLAVFKEGYDQPTHRVYHTLEQMAGAIDSMANSTQLSVYHACASYQHESVEVEVRGEMKVKRRVPSNWDRARSFWVDLDCGQDKFDKGQGYLTKADAVRAIFAFADTVSWPRPMMVDSGNGMHAYWPLTKDIKPESWIKVANLLKASLAHAKVIADPTRTADFSSILRPLGSVNRKGGAAKPVRVRTTCEPTDPRDLAMAILAYVNDNGVTTVKEAKRYDRAPANDLNSDLTGHLPQYPHVDSFGDEIANGCAQVREMRSTLGDVGYEHWRGVIGLLTHCADGLELSESWSERREQTGHDQLDWQLRYDSWGSGPTTCQFFQKCNPTGCDGCEHNGKITSPITLGRVIPINEVKFEQVVTDEGEEVEAVIPAIAHGYTWDGNFLSRMLKDKDGNLQALAFSRLLFYPTSRIRTEDGTYRIGVRMHLPNHKVRDFDMPADAMASQTDMLRALAKYELMHSNHKDAGLHMAAYLRDQLETLKRQVEEVNTLTSFGWKYNNDAFLLGDRLYHKDGTTRRVLVSSGAGKFASAMPPPKGTVAGYAKPLNFIYNRAGMEHWQYAICSGWGSILTPFCEELFKGLILALRGGDSGKGKTTACYASLYAFGDAARMTLNSKDGFTPNALWTFLGAFNNTPVLIDELTNMEASVFSDVAYGVSRGEEKVRLTSKGGTVGFAATSTWRMSPFVTGNKDFHGLLATTQANSQAEAVRLIQIDIDRYPVIHLVETRKNDKPRSEMDRDEVAEIEARESALVQDAMDAMKSHSGAAGEAMVKYVVTHQAEIAELIRDTTSALGQHLQGAKYRYYRAHGACTLVIAQVAKDLGVHDFDLDALFKATVKLLTELAETVSVTNTVTAEDAFNRMMAALAHRIIVTVEFRDKRHKDGPETPRNRVNGEIAGRYVLGSTTRRDCAGQIMINQKDVRDWCMKNRTDYNAVLDQLESSGALIKRMDKVTLTRGTDVPTVQARCIVVDSYKLDKDALTLVSDTSVVVDKAVGDV